MKLTRLLAFAAIGVAAGLLLTQTDKGNELRRNLADRAGSLGKKLRSRSADLMDDASKLAKKARSRADKEMA